MSRTPEEVLDFWFADGLTSPRALLERVAVWFASDPEFDRSIDERFAELPDLAMSGGLDSWRESPRGTAALVIVLDQFPRNLFRESARAFAYDPLALGIARASVDAGVDLELHPAEATFLYLPFEHSESSADQDRCVSLYEALAKRSGAEPRETFENFVGYASQHRDIIREFGRFPHRNSVLGREPTAEEIAFLEEGGADFSGAQLDEDA